MLNLKDILPTDNLFWTADTHFQHKNIIRFTGRPFLTVHEMDKKLIENWNKKIPKDGIVFHLGDFSFGSPGRAEQILSQLNGTIILIVGNHEKTVLQKELTRKYFDSLHTMLEINVNSPESQQGSKRITMCHYPMDAWNKSHFGNKESIHLHGHWHNENHTIKIGRLDVGVDNKFQYMNPWSYEDICRYFEEQEEDFHKEWNSKV